MSTELKPTMHENRFKWIGTRPLRPDGVDKVTGLAKFGADLSMPNTLVGKVLRSPHPHARIKSIDITKAQAFAGVKSVVTSADFPHLPSEFVQMGEVQVNYHDMSHNIMARDKVLYEGHAVAAVAAVSAFIAKRALSLIEVTYEILPHVIDVLGAMDPDAPLLHEEMYTEGIEPPPNTPSNIAKRFELGHGQIELGFEQADVIVERTFDTKPVHQGYIEPHACLARVSRDGQAELWCTTQGQFTTQYHCAKLLDMDISKLRVTASEIGGGFGGKTVIYLEPLALVLSRKAGQPVKMVMTREEVFRATGPAAGAHVSVKIGATREGHITAAKAVLKFQAGAYPGSPVLVGSMGALGLYDLANVTVIGYDVVSNRPKTAPYRAPGGPIVAFAVESVVDELAKKISVDPVELRIKNAAKEGTQTFYGAKFGPIGFVETLEATKAHPHYQAPLGPNQGRGIGSGFWFNLGGETCASVNVGVDGSVDMVVGTPDIGGTRASLCMMVAEELGIDLNKVQPVIGDTGSLGFNFQSGGSRVTFASGLAVIEAARDVVRQLCKRAAMIWEIPDDAVTWESGHARPIGCHAGNFDPLSMSEIAKLANTTGGPITGDAALDAKGAGPSFGTHIVDVEVDVETGRITILRYTVIQDAGRAIHPSHVEGQMQGGAVQGIGWALNEEYIYGEDGLLKNPSFRDYRIPVCSDVPMVDTVIVEIPNPNHPYGVRGVGETPIIPPMAAIANAVENAIGIRFSKLPMSPPRVLDAIEIARAALIVAATD